VGAPAFTPDQRLKSEPLRLHAHETPWGMFDALEQYCCDEGIAFTRYSGACPGSFGAERVVFDATSGALNYDVDEDDHAVIQVHTVELLGPMRVIPRCVKAAENSIPPLVLTR
jgi:hypothetical protein